MVHPIPKYANRKVSSQLVWLKRIFLKPQTNLSGMDYHPGSHSGYYQNTVSYLSPNGRTRTELWMVSTGITPSSWAPLRRLHWISPNRFLKATFVKWSGRVWLAMTWELWGFRPTPFWVHYQGKGSIRNDTDQTLCRAGIICGGKATVGPTFKVNTVYICVLYIIKKYQQL